MTDATIAQELDELLAESVEAASRRASLQLTLGAEPLALYGAGNLGQTVLGNLRRAGIEPVAFADDTPAKQGKTLDGLPIMSPQDVVKRFGAETLFAVTIFNPQASFLRIARDLKEATGARVVSFLSLVWKYPEHFLPFYQFELPQELLTKTAGIRGALQVFADEESQRQFVAHIRFRLWLDFAALPTSGRGDYFPSDVLAALPANTTFVDCGAYDGDTVRRFVKHQQGAFGSIDAFEPDETNCARLRDCVSSLDDHLKPKVRIHHAAVGARREKLRFNSNGTMGSSLSDAGNTEVEVVPIDEIISEQEGPVYLKLDVEGAEREALAGAAAFIRRVRPVIAISIYHCPDDLWELPLYLHQLDLGYRLFLRTQGEDGMDVICYAVPPERLSR